MERTEKPSDLTLASWNIRAGLGTDFRRDAERVLSGLARLGADVAVLQEADFRLGARPSALPLERIEALSGLRPLPVSPHHEGLGWHGIAMLARPGLRASRIDRIDLPGLEPRGAVILDLEGAEVPLRLVGVHLGLLRRSRRQQIDRLKDHLEPLPKRPTVIAGDFNEWSMRRGLGRLVRDFTLLAPARSFPSSRPLVHLDRIAHSSELDVTPLPTPRGRGPHPSDHLPILARIAAVEEVS